MKTSVIFRKLKSVSKVSLGTRRLNYTQSISTWYKLINAPKCSSLLAQSKRIGVVGLRYQSNLKILDKVHTIFVKKGLTDVQRQEELEASTVVHTDHPFLKLYTKKINKYFNLSSSKTWVKSLRRLNPEASIRSTEVVNNLFAVLKSMDSLVSCSGQKSWGPLLLNIIICLGQKFLSSDSKVAKKSHLYKRLFLLEVINSLMVWYKNLITSFVEELLNFIQQLEDKVRLQSHEQAFLDLFLEYKKTNRTNNNKGGQDAPWDHLSNESALHALPEALRNIFLLPEVISNVACVHDQLAVCASTTDVVSIGHLIKVRRTLEADVQGFQFIDEVVASLGLFEEDTITVFDKGTPKRQHVFIFQENVWDVLLKYGPVAEIKFPMTCKPRPWKKNEKENQLYGGGFLLRKTKGISDKNGYETLKVKSKLVDILNGLQDQQYLIDGEVLSFLLGNFDKAAREYVCGGKLLALHTDVVDVVFDNSDGDTLSVIINKMHEKYPAKTVRWINAQAASLLKIIHLRVTDFLFIINLAVEFYNLNTPLYIVWFFDERFRVYPKSGVLSLHGASLAKALLVPVSTKSDLDPALYQTRPCVERAKQGMQENTRGKKFFPFIKFSVHNNIMSHISIDASSSGTQIYSGISGFELGLTKTNFFSTCRSSVKREDLYAYVLSNFINEVFFDLEIRIKDLERLKLLHRKAKNVALALGINTISQEEHNINVKRFKSLFDRELSKTWLMRFAYSEGTKARIEFLSDLCCSNSIFTYIDPWILNKELSCFVHGYIKCLNSALPYTRQILAFYRSLVKDHKGYSYGLIPDQSGYKLEADSTLGATLVQHLKANRPRFSYYRRKGVKKTSSLQGSTYVFDKQHAGSSVAANATHNMDAAICCNTVYLCLKNHVPVVPSHDAFFCRVQDIEEVQRYYSASFVQIVLKQDLLLSFLLNNTSNPEVKSTLLEVSTKGKKLTLSTYKKTPCNKLLPPLSAINLMVELSNNRNFILRKFEKEGLVGSPWVLS